MVDASVAAELSVAPIVMVFAPSVMLPLRVPDIATVPSWLASATPGVGRLPTVRLVTTAGVVSVMLPLLAMDGLLSLEGSVLVAVNDSTVPAWLRLAVIP